MKPKAESLHTKYRTGQLAFTQAEFNKLLQACYSSQERALLLIAGSLGIRRADMVRLLWVNVNLEKRTLTYSEMKKGNRVRTVPIGSTLTQELRIYKTGQGRGDKLIFPFTDRTAWNMLQKICDRAGIPRRPFHALRATCVKLKQKAGWSPAQVAELIGDSLRVVEKHYAVPSDAEMAEQMDQHEGI